MMSEFLHAVPIAAIVVPLLAVSAPKIDGVIGPDEWSEAAVYDGLKVQGKNETFPTRVTTYVTTDEKCLYVAVRSQVPASGLRRRVMPKRDGAYARIDDTVTFTFADRRALAVNANGAHTATGWEPSKDVKFASTVTNGFWNFESVIPLAEAGDLKGLDVGRHWPAAAPAYGRVSSVAQPGGVVPAAGAPRLQVHEVKGGDRAYAVKLRVVNPSDKSVTVDVSATGRPENSQTAGLSKKVTLAPHGAEDLTLTGAILDDELVGLTVGCKTAGQSFEREITVRPNFAGTPFAPRGDMGELVSYRFAYYPSYQKLRVKTDVQLIPDFARTVKAVVCRIFAADGQEVWKGTMTADLKGVADTIFDVPDLRPLTVKSGNPQYRLRIEVEGEGLQGVSYEKGFVRHAMDWEGNKYGLSEIVVPPFTAMTVCGEDGKPCRSVENGEGGVLVRTVLREHEMSSLGLFAQVKCPAKEGATEPTVPILADGGVRLVATVGGKDFPVEGKLTVVPSESPVRRTMKATFDTHGLKGFVDINFEYDGHVNWDLTLEKGAVDALRLVIPFRAKEATHMHNMADCIRSNFGGCVPAGEGSVWNGSMAIGRRGIIGDYLPYWWVGGTLRGLAVYGENDRGWVTGNGHCQEIVREKDGTVKLVFNLVQKPFVFTEPRKIRLGFMATPVKPMLPNWRAVGYGELFGSGNQWGAGPQDANVCPFDETDEFWLKMAEARDTGKIDEAYLEGVYKRMPLPGKPGDDIYKQYYSHNKVHYRSGFDICSRSRRKNPFVWYTNARGVDYGIPSGSTFCDQWNRWEFMDMDRAFTRMSKRDYDLDPDPAFQDYAAWWYRKMILSRACDSLYWDDIYLQSNFDVVGTDAYRLPDGRVQPATGVNNMRGLVKRCATVQAELGANATNNWIHMTDSAIAPISAFAGVHYDMEDIPSKGEAYQQKYPMDYLEAVSIGRQMGCRVKVMAHYPNISKEKSAWYERIGAGVMLCYEFGWKWNAKVFNAIAGELRQWGYRTDPSVRVWNYWNGDEPYPIEVRTEKAASIVMARRGEAIVVVSDFSGKGGTCRVKPDREALGLAPGAKAYDFERVEKVEGVERYGEVGMSDGAAVFDLKPYDFRIIIFK